MQPTFDTLGLSPVLLRAVREQGFTVPTPVQAGAIPPALEGRDVLATAQTGTGKTLSFLVPIVEMLEKADARGANALVLLPTRELAMQVEKVYRAIRPNQANMVA